MPMQKRKVVAVYASAARTSTPTAVTIPTKGARGVIVEIDSTAASTPSTTPKVEGVLPSGAVYPLITGSAIVATGQVALKVYPGITVAANVAVSDALPDQIKITLTHGNANSHTYAVTAVLIP